VYDALLGQVLLVERGSNNAGQQEHEGKDRDL
jgi:hypothetical protein